MREAAAGYSRAGYDCAARTGGAARRGCHAGSGAELPEPGGAAGGADGRDDGDGAGVRAAVPELAGGGVLRGVLLRAADWDRRECRGGSEVGLDHGGADVRPVGGDLHGPATGGGEVGEIGGAAAGSVDAEYAGAGS